MLGERKAKLMALGWGAFLAFFTFLAWTDFALVRNREWCGQLDQHCLRDWIAAFSGWAAAGAAAITVYFLMRQNDEQKKQTDFLLGNGLPTIDAVRHMVRDNEVVVRVVNWNRRPIIIHGLKFLPATFETALMRTRLESQEGPNDLKIRSLIDGRFDAGIAMHGWKNRSKGPCEVRIDLGGRAIEGFEWISDWSGHIIEVQLTIAGEEEAYLNLTCPIAMAA